jgi:hypothetical protein
MPSLRNTHATEVARRQIDALLGMAEQAGIESDRLQRLLRLSQSDWQEWLEARDENAPIPAEPALPLLLRHLGWLTSRLDRVARSAYA